MIQLNGCQSTNEWSSISSLRSTISFAYACGWNFTTIVTMWNLHGTRQQKILLEPSTRLVIAGCPPGWGEFNLPKQDTKRIRTTSHERKMLKSKNRILQTETKTNKPIYSPDFLKTHIFFPKWSALNLASAPESKETEVKGEATSDSWCTLSLFCYIKRW